jgi:hypothetical protein
VILNHNPSPAPLEGSDRRAVLPLTVSDDAVSVVINGDALQDGLAHFGTANPNASGVAVLRYAQASATSETVVPAVFPKTRGAVAFRLDRSFKTALAIANLGTTTTEIRLATDSRTSTRISLAAGHKIAAFLDASPFDLKAASGTLYWESDSPINVTALQTFRDDSHPFLMANLPVADPESLSSASLYLPILPASQESVLSLVNPTETELKGSVTWFNNSGTRSREEAFVVQARSSLQLSVPDTEGWIQITPTANAFAPEAILTSVLRYGDRADLVTVSGQATRAKWSVQIANSADARLSIEIINPLPTPARVTLNSKRTISIAPLSTLMISDAGPREIVSESPIALTMLRTQTSGSKTYISASYPHVVNGASVFPHFAVGQSFSTQFILNGLKDRHGVLRFIGSDGEPLPVKWTTQ